MVHLKKVVEAFDTALFFSVPSLLPPYQS